MNPIDKLLDLPTPALIGIGPIVFLIMYFHEQRQLKVQREYEQKATAKHHQVDASSLVSKLYPKE